MKRLSIRSFSTSPPPATGRRAPVPSVSGWRNIIPLTTLCLSTIILGATPLSAAEPGSRQWLEFRNGGSSQTVGQLPRQWTPQAITWQHELEGYGQSTPVIRNDRIYVTSVDGPMKEECVVSCFALQSGQQLWSQRIAASSKGPSNYMASRAAPTPIVDQQAVYVFFESGDVLALNHQGQRLWHRSLTEDYGAFDNNHGLGCSPTQNASHLFLNIEHKGPSYLVALDKASGQTSWKVERPSTSSWSSPIVLDSQGAETAQVIVSSAGTVDSYAASSGDKLWSIGGLDGNSVPSPTPDGSLIFVGARVPEFGTDGQATRSNLCIQLPSDATQGDKNPHIKWRSDKAVSDYASPIVCEGCVYFLNKIGVLYCLDKQTGQLNYMQRLGTQCWATPIVVNDYVYFFGKDGKTQVIQAGKEFQLLHSNHLWDESSPPKPERYVEYVAASTEGERGGSERGGRPERGSNERGGNSTGGGRSGGMMATLMKSDANGDGVLSADEIPTEFKPMLARIDTNGDGQLDAAEIKAMAESFASRRGDSREAARDPIVYGAAAVDGAIVIRTGTRLYCISN